MLLSYSSHLDAYWKGSGPLFFYTGNEGAIEGFYDNTGFLFELAQNFSALIVFAEHVSHVYNDRGLYITWYSSSLPDSAIMASLYHMAALRSPQATWAISMQNRHWLTMLYLYPSSELTTTSLKLLVLEEGEH